MQRPQAHADHTHGRIEDPLDATGINLVAWQGERIVGCVRASLARDGRLEFHDALYDMAAHSPDYPHGVGIVTRLMLARELRGSEFTTRLFLRLYRLSLQQGVQHAYMDCNAHLQPLFLRFGFVAHIPVREHPEYGLVQPMRLDLHDHAHLARVASPYLPELQAFRQTTQVSAGHPAKLGQ
jgi:predicted GNAT family N-acyltransferase